MSKKTQSAPDEASVPMPVKIPIKWHIPDSIVTRYANNMVVQVLENEFKVMFFEISLPATPGATLPTEATAECVASIIIPPEKLGKYAKLLNDTFENYQRSATKVQFSVPSAP